MTWTIKPVACLILTSVSGSILFIFWYFLGRLLEKVGFLNILYEFMKLVMVFFTVPVLFFAMRWMDDTFGTYKGDLFVQTQLIMTVCGSFLVLWLAAACFMLYRQMRLVYRTKQLFSASFPCERHVEELFEEIRQKMGIPEGKVALARCYQTPMAVLWGIRRPTVVLPVETYSDEELEVIFVHELTHYKHNDILWRRLASALIVIHCFNPLVWKLYKLLRKWSEYACDFAAYEAAGGLKHYFLTIMKIQIKSAGLNSYFGVALSENKNELEERIKKMKIQKRIQKRSAWKAAVICAVMMLLNSLTVIAASEGMGMAYHAAYEATSSETELPLPPKLQEYEESGETEGIVEEIGEVDELSRSSKSFNWSIASGIRKKSAEFSAKAGNSIGIMVMVSPADKSVRVGIIKPDGTRRYVTGKGTVQNTFSISQSGTYQVYVENASGTKVTVEGTYIVK
ncbi:M56 family metallopeptidase [Lachnospiraceae bacterium MD308]|nr:M56 family metallopeptidase [Lachnospiraceae bacterium MD308]